MSESKSMGPQVKSRDYFAEMYVAGIMADEGWNLYFPHRDVGFDMIATRVVGSETRIRPVQVKGKYASDEKTRKQVYGFVGKLTALHPNMLLVIPYFTSSSAAAPSITAWMPFDRIKKSSRGFACEPATYRASGPEPRRDFAQYFDDQGLAALLA